MITPFVAIIEFLLFYQSRRRLAIFWGLFQSKFYVVQTYLQNLIRLVFNVSVAINGSNVVHDKDEAIYI